MKKIVFIFTTFFMLFLLSETITANIETDYEKAIRYYNTGKYKDAVKIFKESVAKKPEPSTYYRIGYALYELGEYREANEYFKEAYLIDPAYSPKLTGSYHKYPKHKSKKAIKPSGKQVTSKEKPRVPARMQFQPK